jgi:hypothetical protein
LGFIKIEEEQGEETNTKEKCQSRFQPVAASLVHNGGWLGNSGLPEGLFFKPKFPVWVNFGVPLIGKYVYILCPYVIFYGL